MADASPPSPPPPKPEFRSDPYVTGDPNDPGRPWYVRHRMRALLVTALIPVAVGVVAFLAVWLTVQSGLKSHPVYADALAMLRESPAVQAELGTAFDPGFLTTGKADRAAGTAEMMFSVRAEQASAGVRVFARYRPDGDSDADVEAGHWEITFLDVGVKHHTGREKVVTLVAEEEPDRFADDA